MDKRYIVEGNLKHDSASYATNDIVVLSDEQAAPLLAIGRIKLAEDIAAPAAPAPDGFPDHSLDDRQAPEAPAVGDGALPPAVNPEQPLAAPAGQPDAGEQLPPQQPAPANTTPEQIAKDLEQVK